MIGRYCWLGDRKDIRSVKSWVLCWFVYGDDLTLELWMSYSSGCHHSPPTSSLAPINPEWRHSVPANPRPLGKGADKIERMWVHKSVDRGRFCSFLRSPPIPHACCFYRYDNGVERVCVREVLRDLVSCRLTSCCPWVDTVSAMCDSACLGL